MTNGELETFYDLSRPRKLLALDGGGIRGALTLEVLVKIEDMLAQKTGKGKDFRLCQFFHYIAGTSTGAIIAAALARGMSATEVLQFYKHAGPDMFDKAWLLARIHHVYKTQPLTEQLKPCLGLRRRWSRSISNPSYSSLRAMSRPIHPGPSAVIHARNTTIPPVLTAT